MKGEIRIEAFAKINVHLRILNRGPDGFHGIESLFQTIGISDSLVARSLKDAGESIVEGDFDCPPEHTTIFRAIEAFSLYTGIAGRFRIKTEKRIPPMSGLGGGSADAAATLVALDLLTGSGLSGAELSAIAKEIGSDVPFFLGGSPATAEGRGEILRPAEPRPDYGIVLVRPRFGIPTGWAYAALDEDRAEGLDDRGLRNGLFPDASSLAGAYLGPARGWPFFNSFEAVIARRKPACAELRLILERRGADFVSLTGSGSCYFGAFENPEAARLAAKVIGKDLAASDSQDLRCADVWATRPLASPLSLV